MTQQSEPVIETLSSAEDWTKISFRPDLGSISLYPIVHSLLSFNSCAIEKFGMQKLDNDIIGLMSKRVYDIAGCNPALKVVLNGEQLNVSSFAAYAQHFLSKTNEVMLACLQLLFSYQILLSLLSEIVPGQTQRFRYCFSSLEQRSV
jgi:DNA topoisomerase-2